MQAYMTSRRPKTGPGLSGRRKKARRAGIRRSPMEQLHEMHQTIGNQAVQREVMLSKYNGKKNVLFDKPFGQATDKLLELDAISNVGRGVVMTLRAMVKDAHVHTFADVNELAQDLTRQVGGGRKRKADHNKEAKSRHKKRSRRAIIVNNPDPLGMKTGRTLAKLGKVSLAALREHERQKKSYKSNYESFKKQIETKKGVGSGDSGNTLTNMIMFGEYINKEGLEQLHGKIHDVSFGSKLNHETNDRNEGFSKTHVSLSETKRNSAYSVFPLNNLPLPLVSDNKSQQTLNAVESNRNSGAFMFSQAGKFRALTNNWMTPEDAVDPLKYGSYEISGVSGKHRNDFSDRLAYNNNETYQMLLDNNDKWTKKLGGHIDTYQNKKSKKEEKFQAMKEGSRHLLKEVKGFTNQDYIEYPSTPEYRAVYEDSSESD